MPQDLSYQKFIIQQIIRETPDAKTFLLRQTEGAPVQYRAGQFLTFLFPKANGEDRRSYSLSSAPDLNEPLSITVKRVENGAYSRYLIDKAREGDELICSGSSGFFTLPENITDFKQVFFIAAGSGITPVYALIKTLLQYPELSIVLIYSNRSPADTIFYKELIELSYQSKGRLIIDFLFSSSNNILKARLSNSLLASLLAERSAATREQTLCYTCGPMEYMDTVIITLLTEGIPPANIRKENFSSYLPEIKEEPEDQQPHLVTINLPDRKVAFTVQYPVSILQQAKKEGIRLPYSCESGQCGSCTARCIRGKVWIAYNEVLTDKELNEGLILTCQGYPIHGDVELSY